MKNYVSQLLADMKSAAKNLPSTPNYKDLYPDHPAHDFGLEYIVAWECTPFEPMSDIYGIKAEAFPPDDKLTDEEVAELNDGILQLWLAYNTDADIPDNAPPRLLYKVLRDAWANEEIQFFSPEMGGFSTMEFCDVEPESCRWGAFCKCIESAKEFEKEHEEFQKRYDAGEFDDVQPPITSYMGYYNHIHGGNEGDLPF